MNTNITIQDTKFQHLVFYHKRVDSNHRNVETSIIATVFQRHIIIQNGLFPVFWFFNLNQNYLDNKENSKDLKSEQLEIFFPTQSTKFKIVMQ